MDNQKKEILGAGITAIGTITSAIGSTPIPLVSKEVLNDLNLWGNVLQAGGNALQAEGQGQPSLEKIGNVVQAIGNLTVLSGLIIPVQKEAGQRLNITGNWLQALGGLVSLADELVDQSNQGQAFNISGNLLQSVGNSLQAISGTKEIENTRLASKGYRVYGSTVELNVIGSWVQATGAVLSFIGEFKEEKEE